MPESIPIPFPLGGMDQSRSFDGQSTETCSFGKNVRSRDPLTGRYRGAQRSGLSRYVSPQVEPSFFQDLVQVVIDTKLSSFTVRNTTQGPTVDWQAQVPGKDSVVDIAVTRGGDVFVAVPPDKVSKYTPEGTLLFTTQVPTTGEGEYISAVQTDTFDDVYVAVRAGIETRHGGKIVHYKQVDGGLEELWTITLNGASPADIKVKNGRMYVITNEDGQGRLIVYEALQAATPIVLWERFIPTRAVAIDLNDDGDAFVCFDEDATRDDVDTSNCGTSTVGWNPLAWSGAGLWSWYAADSMTGFANLEIPEAIPDLSGNLRDLFPSPPSSNPVDYPGTRGVRYKIDSFCGYPAFEFWGERDNQGRPPGLVSGAGSLAWAPYHQNEPFFVAFILKSRARGDETFGKLVESGSKPYKTIGQTGDGRQFWVSNDYPRLTGVRTTHPWRTRTFPNDFENGANGEPGVTILVAAYSPTVHPDGVELHSMFRLNGLTVDAFTCTNIASGDPPRIGYDVYGPHIFVGDVLEIVVFQGVYDLPGSGTPSPGNGGPDAEQSDGQNAQYIPPQTNPGGNPAGYYDGDEQITLIEGYFAHKYGQQSKLPDGHFYKTIPPFGASPSAAADDATEARKLESEQSILAKFAAGSGALRWAVTGNGYGYGVRARDGAVYSIGRGDVQPSPEGNFTVRKIIDNGFEVDTDGSSTWELALTQPQAHTDEQDDVFPVRMDVDAGGNLYVPVKSSIPGSDDYSIRKIDSTGTKLWDYKVPIAASPPDYQWGRVAKLDTISDVNDPDINEPEFLYLGTDHITPGNDDSTLWKLRLVDVDVALGAPREMRVIAMINGVFKRILSESQITDDSPQQIFQLTNEGDTPDPLARVVRSTVLNQDAFFVNGEFYWRYDHENDKIVEWKASNGGKLPVRARLTETWRGRVLLARTDGEPGNIYASKQGDPLNYDLFPPVITATQAWSLEAAQAGQVPDMINGLIPYSDDILLILCDHQIWQLTGDPMAGGVLDLVSDSIGGAFGRAWCKDDQGNVYFFGSRGGLFIMRPGQIPERLSDPKLDDRMSRLDLDFYTVRMAWNDRDKAVHMFVVPIDVVNAGDPPEVTLTAPSPDPAFFDVGDTVNLTATATDTEDGDLTSSIKWFSSINGDLGTGGSLTTTALTEGTHTISATVTDSTGNTASATTSVIVADAGSPPQIVIDAPGDGESKTTAQTFTFEGTAYDTDDGDLSSSIVWTATDQSDSTTTALGTGASVSATGTAIGGEGVYTITASVTDTGANTATDTITIIVRPAITIDPPIIDPNTFDVFTGDPAGRNTNPNQGPVINGAGQGGVSAFDDEDGLFHWVWERSTGSFWEDVFGNALVDPTAVLVVDGDKPDDRAMLLGSTDGYLRKWDREAYTDDGHTIESAVAIGPIRPRQTDSEFEFNQWDIVLAPNQNGASVDLYVSENAEDPGSSFKTFNLSKGRNERMKSRAKGNAVWMVLKNTTNGTRWAFESAMCRGDYAGQGRTR